MDSARSDHELRQQGPYDPGASREALERVLRVHGPRLLSAARRLLTDPDEARDAFQDGMLAAWKSMPSFEGRAQMSTWLHRIVINHALMRLRKKGSADDRSLDDHLPLFTEYGHFRSAPARWGEGPDLSLQRKEAREMVQSCIAQLPDSSRVPLVLRDIEGMEVAEVAEMLGISSNAVRVRVHRGRQLLKALLEPRLMEETS